MLALPGLTPEAVWGTRFADFLILAAYVDNLKVEAVD